MKRDFLKELGLEQEVIDKIMDEHGKTMTTTKEAFEETKKQFEAKISSLEKRADISPEKLTELKNGLKAVEEKLKAYDGVDIADLKSKLTAAEGKLTSMTDEYSSKISDLEADALIRENLATVKFSSKYARDGIYAELKSKVKYEGGKLTGLDETLAELKEKQASAFVVEKQEDATGKAGGAPHKEGSSPPPKKPIPIII